MPSKLRAESLEKTREFATYELPYVYGRYLSDRLLNRIADAAGLQDRFSINDELDLVRATALDAIKLYDASLQAEGDNALQMQISAGVIVRETMREVAEMVERAIDIESKRNDVLSVGSLHLIVAQVAEMAHESFGEDPQMIPKIRQFADSLRAIRLPQSEICGTVRTPDMDVLDMDATVPSSPDAVLPQLGLVDDVA